MIFLAVTLGFFAEGLREHIGERGKEKEYMVSLLQELKSDTAGYQKTLGKIDVLEPALDSSYTNVKEPARFNNQILGKWQIIINEISVENRPSLTTIQQMQSSGNLRLIEKQAVVIKILSYHEFVKGPLERLNNMIQTAVGKVYALEDAYCDYTNFRKVNSIGYSIIHDTLLAKNYTIGILEKDPMKLNGFANSFINYRETCLEHKAVILTSKNLATDLIKLIAKEYNTI